jgi:catechol 2,3-dioxygenase-like lactoylglutathione lyase family enzyme
MLRAVNHVAFVVADVERSIEWYTRNFGFSIAVRQRQDNAYTRRLVGLPDAVLEVAHLRLPGVDSTRSPTVELIQYVAPISTMRQNSDVNSIGAAHLAFSVDDLWSMYQALREIGVEFYSPPIAIELGANKGGYTCYLADPDGNRLELFQPPCRVSNEVPESA